MNAELEDAPAQAGVIRIVVDGAPVGKGRPRFIRATGIAFTPAKTANYEAIVSARGAEAMAGRPPLDGPLRVVVTAFMPLAVSWSKKKTRAALNGSMRPGRPDIDNVFKAVADGLNEIVWRDDAQIADARIVKLYDLDPRLEIDVWPLVEASIERKVIQVRRAIPQDLFDAMDRAT